MGEALIVRRGGGGGGGSITKVTDISKSVKWNYDGYSASCVIDLNKTYMVTTAELCRSDDSVSAYAFIVSNGQFIGGTGYDNCNHGVDVAKSRVFADETDYYDVLCFNVALLE